MRVAFGYLAFGIAGTSAFVCPSLRVAASPSSSDRSMRLQRRGICMMADGGGGGSGFGSGSPKKGKKAKAPVKPVMKKSAQGKSAQPTSSAALPKSTSRASSSSGSVSKDSSTQMFSGKRLEDDDLAKPDFLAPKRKVVSVNEGEVPSDVDIEAMLKSMGVKGRASVPKGVEPPKPGEYDSVPLITVFDVVPMGVQNIFETGLKVGFACSLLAFIGVGCAIGLEAYAKATSTPMDVDQAKFIVESLEPAFTPLLGLTFAFSIVLGIFKLGQAQRAGIVYTEEDDKSKRRF